MSRSVLSLRDWLAFVTLGFVWGAPFLLIKFAVRGVAAIDVAWCELTFGAAALLAVASLRGKLRGLNGHWWPIIALGLLQLAIPSLLTAVSERWIRSSLAGTLNATTPLLVVPLAPLFGLRQPLHVLRAGGLLVGIAGVVVLLGFGVPIGGYEWAGVLCMLTAALSYAAAPLIIQRYLQGMPGLGPSALSLAVGSAVLLPAALVSVPSRMPSILTMGCLAGLGIICTAGGMLLYFLLVEDVGAARASVVKYLNPGVAAILGALVLGEPFPLSSILGLIMILVGSWLATQLSANGGSATRAKSHGETRSASP
jgi:drug/metabolite transporter (DMT)-like permease